MVVIAYKNGDITAESASKVCLLKEHGLIRIERDGCIPYEVDISAVKTVMIDSLKIYKSEV